MSFWFILGLASAFFDAVSSAVNKKLTRNIDELPASAIFLLGISLILFSISLIKGIPDLLPGFFFFTIASGLINIPAILLYFKSIKNTDLSLTIPLLSFTPIFMLLSSFVILGEFPPLAGVIGIIFIVTGVYILNFSWERKNLLEPLLLVFKNRYMLFMVVVAFIYSIAASLDKIAVLKSDAFFGSAVKFLIAGTGLALLSGIKKREITHFTNSAYKFLSASIAASLAIIFVNYAFTLTLASYAITTKRMSILFSVLFGFIVFKERYFFRRLIATALMAIGVALILIF